MLDDLSVVENDFVSIDIEGDGNVPPSPVEICAVSLRPGGPAEVAQWLINPGKPMSSFVQKLHGITDDMVKDAPSFREVEPEVRQALTGRAVVAHAVREDMRLLRTVMPDVDFLPAILIDTQRMARALLPGLERYRLESVCEALGLAREDGEGRAGFHTAPTDAKMAGAVFRSLVSRIPDSPKMRRHIAHMAQIRLSPSAQARRRQEVEELSIPEPEGQEWAPFLSPRR